MTFKELQDRALDRLQYDYSLVTSLPRTRIKTYINEWNKRILGDPRFSHLREGQFTFGTTAGTYQYAVPMAMEKIRRIYDAKGNNPGLMLGDGNWYRRDPQAQIAQGTPAYYIPIGLRPVERLPYRTGVFISSDGPTDAMIARLNGVLYPGYPYQTSVALTGQVRVGFPGPQEYIDITALSLASVATGNVHVFDSGAPGPSDHLLATIPLGQLSARAYLLNLYPVPSSAIDYTIDGRWTIQDMLVDSDQSILTDSYDQVLYLCACYEELLTWKKETDLAQNLMQTHITPLLTAFLDSVANPDTQVLIPEDGRTRSSRSSNLGSWFPAGRW
jgi:hypothetical protein